MSQRPDASDPQSGVFFPIYRYAQRYPWLPIVTILDCAQDVMSDASLLTVDHDEWLKALDRAMEQRLAALESAQAIPHRERRGHYRRRGA